MIRKYQCERYTRMAAMRPLMLLPVLLFAGCAKVEPVVTRFDGAPPEANKVAYEQAMTECEAKANVSASQLPYTHGRNGGMAYEMDKINVRKAALRGCLAERGYKIDWQKKDA